MRIFCEKILSLLTIISWGGVHIGTEQFQPVFTDLSMLFDVPLTIELVSPKWTLDGISLMVSFAIGALEHVRAGFALLGFESGWVYFIVSFTAPTELSVMFRLVWAVAFDTS